LKAFSVIVALVRVRVHFYSYFKDLAGAAEVGYEAFHRIVEHQFHLVFEDAGKRPVIPGL
jgi:hypothetical protein